ncbi:MAG: protein-L-isoaspartate(D-aspartate) O-methyltransferase [Nevskiales bacterium]
MIFALPPLACAVSEEEFAVLRQRMVGEIAVDARLISAETGRAQFDPKVMQVMGRVPRHRFVPPEKVRQAYDNRPLGIGHGQTISQPLIVALMTDLLQLQPEMSVLEIGTGSGYQAAVLAELVRQVYSIEIVEPLASEAAARLKGLGYKNITVRAGDGYQGWPAHAPFDRIIVTAAAPSVPPPLIAQLKPGGRMVIPVGESFDVQQLMVLTKDSDGKISSRPALPVRFVPLTGKHQ